MKTVRYLTLATVAVLITSCCDKREAQPSFDPQQYDEVPNPVEPTSSMEWDTQTSPSAKVYRALTTPKARIVSATITQTISSKYNVSHRAIVLGSQVDQKLGGVLKGFGQHIVNQCRQVDICPLFVTAVLQHESDNGTSRIAKECNNVAGIMKGKTPVEFDDVQSCIDFTINLLSNGSYAGKKRTTVQAIQQRYCPIGAGNDPKGINKHWLGGVQKWMKITFGGDVVHCIAN